MVKCETIVAVWQLKMPPPLDVLADRIGRVIRSHRAAQGMSLGDLARASGLSKTILARIEGGDGNPSLETLWRISRALRVPLGALLARGRGRRACGVIRHGAGEELHADSGMSAWLLHADGRERRTEVFELRVRRGRRAARRAAPARDRGADRLHRAGACASARPASRSSSTPATRSGSPPTSPHAYAGAARRAGAVLDALPGGAAMSEREPGALQPILAGVGRVDRRLRQHVRARARRPARGRRRRAGRPPPGSSRSASTMGVVAIGLGAALPDAARDRLVDARRGAADLLGRAVGRLPGRARRVRGRRRADRARRAVADARALGGARSRPRSRARCSPACCCRSASRPSAATVDAAARGRPGDPGLGAADALRAPVGGAGRARSPRAVVIALDPRRRGRRRPSCCPSLDADRARARRSARCVSLALPLFVVTMASQNIPGMGVLASFGYRPPLRPGAASRTGAATVVGAPFGAHAINLAAITAALVAGPDAHPDPARRWIASAAGGVVYLVLGLAAGAATDARRGRAAAADRGGRRAGAVRRARRARSRRPRPTPSGARRRSSRSSSARPRSRPPGISAPFWGLVAGLAYLGLQRARPGRRAAQDAPRARRACSAPPGRGVLPGMERARRAARARPLAAAELGGGAGGIGGVHDAIAQRVFGALGPSAAPARRDARRDRARRLRLACGAARRSPGAPPTARSPCATPATAARSPRRRAAPRRSRCSTGCYGDALEAEGSDLAEPMAVRVGGRVVAPERAALAAAFPAATAAARRLRARADGDRARVAARRPRALRRAARARPRRHAARRPLQHRPPRLAERALAGRAARGARRRVAGAASRRSRSSATRWAASSRAAPATRRPRTGRPGPAASATSSRSARRTAARRSRRASTTPRTRCTRCPRRARSRASCAAAARASATCATARSSTATGRAATPTRCAPPRAPRCRCSTGATHCFVTATITRDARHPVGRLLGDALVLAPSASGRGRTRRIPFREEDGLHVGGAHHLALLNHPAVYAQLRAWLQAAVLAAGRAAAVAGLGPRTHRLVGARRGRRAATTPMRPSGSVTSVPTGNGITMRRKTPTTAGRTRCPRRSVITCTPTCGGAAGAYGRWLVIAS